MAKMKGFQTQLTAMLLTDRKTWVLQSPLIFHDPVVGRIVVPIGVETDFASTRPVRTLAVVLLLISLVAMLLGLGWVQKLAFALGVLALAVYAAVAGYASGPAALHDFLYQTGVWPRPTCDRILQRAMRLSGESRWRGLLFWLGVRIGGLPHYTRPDGLRREA